MPDSLHKNSLLNIKAKLEEKWLWELQHLQKWLTHDGEDSKMTIEM
jgi:hypothetical protein